MGVFKFMSNKTNCIIMCNNVTRDLYLSPKAENVHEQYTSHLQFAAQVHWAHAKGNGVLGAERY